MSRASILLFFVVASFGFAACGDDDTRSAKTTRQYDLGVPDQAGSKSDGPDFRLPANLPDLN
jgi:hypothetical protein